LRPLYRKAFNVDGTGLKYISLFQWIKGEDKTVFALALEVYSPTEHWKKKKKRNEVLSIN
jgi:hypothetical protein